MESNKKYKIDLKCLVEHSFRDNSVIFLLFSNILSIVLAIFQNWSLITIMLIYWFQSVTIGFFNFVRILTLKKFSTKNLKINNRKVEPSEKTKFFIAFFFAFHYGLFHIVYLAFILGFGFLSIAVSGAKTLMPHPMDMFYIPLMGIMFFFNHMYSFLHNKKIDEDKIQNIGRIMFFPYIRIIPMHITVMIVFFLGNSAIVPFLILKTFADIAMHIIEHHNYDPLIKS